MMTMIETSPGSEIGEEICQDAIEIEEPNQADLQIENQNSNSFQTSSHERQAGQSPLPSENQSMIPWEQVEEEDIRGLQINEHGSESAAQITQDLEVENEWIEDTEKPNDQVLGGAQNQDEVFQLMTSEKASSVAGGLQFETHNLNTNIPAGLCDEKLIEELQSIPQRMGFRIGEVAEMLGIKQYVLRYWETEFELLKPKKASNKQRIFTRRDVENAFLIRKLLHRDRFSIEGARNALKEMKSSIKKEKEIVKVYHRLDHVHQQIEGLVEDIRQLRQLTV